VGREHELGVITAQLHSPAVQLLTLIGAGGIGKSRLALAAAATLIDDFADGVWFVPLAPVAKPSQVVAAVAEALAVPDAGGHLRDYVREFLERRHLLLVLDNFEHLLPAATLVAELIGEAPWLKVLGEVICPTIGPTRNEADFLAHIRSTVACEPGATRWHVISDNLNTHCSESLVRYVADVSGITDDLAINDKCGILKSMATRAAFLADASHRSSSITRPSTRPG
jgi:hypothetical protein